MTKQGTHIKLPVIYHTEIYCLLFLYIQYPKFQIWVQNITEFIQLVQTQILFWSFVTYKCEEWFIQKLYIKVNQLISINKNSLQPYMVPKY